LPGIGIAEVRQWQLGVTLLLAGNPAYGNGQALSSRLRVEEN
jgi:hypothetical protein